VAAARGLFVAEGRLIVERLLGSGGIAIESVLVTPAAVRALGARLEAVDPAVLVCRNLEP
jgi:hypothetical protein